MDAYVIPMLNCTNLTLPDGSAKQFLAVMIRAFGDFAATLRDALISQARLWKSPPNLNDLSSRDILERVGTRLKTQSLRLVLALDQFEEVVVGVDPNAQAIPPAVALAKSLIENPIDAITCVLVTRSEYADAFQSFGLPLRFEKDTWQDVPPFYVKEAATFMLQGLTQIRGPQPDNNELAAALARQAEALGDMPQYATPIALNLSGVMFESDPALGRKLAATETKAVKGVIATYVRTRIDSREIRDVAPAILDKLVTPTGQREKPLGSVTMANATGIVLSRVDIALYTLARYGLVRQIGQHWEVSHDFLAVLIRLALKEIDRAPWRRARVIAKITLVTVLTAIALIAVKTWGLKRDAEAARTEFERYCTYDAATGEVVVRGAFTLPTIRYLQGLGRIISLDLSNSKTSSESLRAIRRLKTIDNLNLEHTEVTDLDLKVILADPGFHLESMLNLSNTEVTDDGVTELACADNVANALGELHLYRTKITLEGIRTLSGRHTGLRALKVLILGGPTITDADVKELARPDTGLKELKALHLYETMVSEQGLRAMASSDTGLQGLEVLILNGTPITDKGLNELARTGTGLKELRVLSLCESDVTDQGLMGLARNGTGLACLGVLDLRSARITDDGLRYLFREESGLGSLRSVDARDTRITRDCVRTITNERPDIRIVLDVQ